MRGGQLRLGDAAAFGQFRGSGQVRLHLAQMLLPDQSQVCFRHEAALAGHGVDEALGFQFVVGPLGGDDGYFQVFGQPPDRGQRLPRHQGSGDDLILDL